DVVERGAGRSSCAHRELKLPARRIPDTREGTRANRRDHGAVVAEASLVDESGVVELHNLLSFRNVEDAGEAITSDGQQPFAVRAERDTSNIISPCAARMRERGERQPIRRPP